MKFKSLIRNASATLFIAMIGIQSGMVSAQDARSRRAAPQYGEPSWTLPSDTVISVQMNGTLSSRTARVGDKFNATVTVPVYVNGRTVIPAGSIIEGRVTQVTPAKRMNRSGTIGIDFDDLVFPNGARVGLVGSLTSDDPETRRRIDDESRVSGEGNKRPSVFIGGGGAIGAVLGGIAGGGKGAVLGGVVGAGAGVAGVLLSKGEEAQVPSGTPFGVQIKQPLIIRESFIMEGATVADAPADQPPDRQLDRTNSPDASRSQPENPDRTVEPTREPESPVDAESPAATVPDLPLSSPEMVRRAQLALKEQGYYEGETDGVMNARTSGALRAYQREHNLQETGDLDPQTAKKLGIAGASNIDRTPDRPRETRTASAATSETVLANVVSATANRTQQGAISVLINTQANTGGWRWFGEQLVNGDTLEVYARAVRPTGMVTQALTRGRIELTVREGAEYVRRVVIHSAGGDQVIMLGGRTDAGLEPSPPPGNAASSASTLQRKAEDLLAEYQRVYGVRMTGSGVELDNAGQYREAEIELLFAIDGFANAAQLYARLASSLRDRQSMRGATLAMARQARRTDRVISTTTSRAADSLAAKWDSMRQDVLKLMQAHGINSSEIEN
jgi:peptidoglycan hydrolase-like protein with peptidoglycan-binding domain